MISFKQFIAESNIEDETGQITWNWKSDLDEEEDDENYIPAPYKKKVLELSNIETMKRMWLVRKGSIPDDQLPT